MQSKGISNNKYVEKVLSPLVKKLKLNNLQYTWNIDSFFSVKTYKLKNVQD